MGGGTPLGALPWKQVGVWAGISPAHQGYLFLSATGLFDLYALHERRFMFFRVSGWLWYCKSLNTLGCGMDCVEHAWQSWAFPSSAAAAGRSLARGAARAGGGKGKGMGQVTHHCHYQQQLQE